MPGDAPTPTRAWENLGTGHKLELAFQHLESTIDEEATSPPTAAGAELRRRIKDADPHIPPQAQVHLQPEVNGYTADAYNGLVEALCPSRFVVAVRLIMLVILPFFLAATAQIQWTWNCASNNQVVPVTLQTLGAMLNGVLVGRTYGTLATALYVLYVAVGAPLAAKQTGLPMWKAGSLGPTGGYLLGFIFLTLCVGHATRRGGGRFRLHSGLCACQSNFPWLRISPSARSLLRLVGWMIAGHVGLYILGILWLQASARFDANEAIKQGLVCFIPGDIVKMGIAVVLVPALWTVGLGLTRCLQQRYCRRVPLPSATAPTPM